MSRRSLIAGAAALVAASPTVVASAPSSKLLDPKWRQTGRNGDPEYGAWSEFLAQWVRVGSDGVARVDYAGALAAGARGPLSAWLAETQKIDPTTLTSDAAMAWWVNLYNAATIDLVLSEYPVRTILKIHGGLFNTGPWDEPILLVNGERLTLNNVEHGILRPIWADPRIHYAVNCASIGCPNLAQSPWRSEGLNARLSAAAAEYINHPRGARIEDGDLIVSKIFDWFEEDFGGSSSGVIAHLREHATGSLAQDLASIQRISDSEYDWRLNAA